MSQTPASVYLYTDGACLGNPGPGGWGAILKWKDEVKELSGSQADTTNNQMELMAVIRGLAALKRPIRVHIVTDSKYVMNGVQDWMPKWKLNNWRTAAKNQWLIKNYGNSWTRYVRCIKLAGNGLKAILAIQ